jgi:hypothetical protein
VGLAASVQGDLAASKVGGGQLVLAGL